MEKTEEILEYFKDKLSIEDYDFLNLKLKKISSELSFLRALQINHDSTQFDSALGSGKQQEAAWNRAKEKINNTEKKYGLTREQEEAWKKEAFRKMNARFSAYTAEERELRIKRK